MLLATGQGQYADLIERTLFNGFLSGIALDGERFFYVNPLLSNGLGEVIGRGGHERRPWYLVACCPPNVMRLLGSLPQYCASSDARGVQLHQYVAGSVSVGAVELRLDTEYPWQGAVALTVERTAAEPWTLSLRRPGWCAVATVVCNGSSVEPPLVDGYWQLERTWQVGDRVELTLEMPVRLTRAHPRVEACAGQVAVERGPIVYCFEQCDHPDGAVLDVTLDGDAPLEARWEPDLLQGVTVVAGRGTVSAADGPLYAPTPPTAPSNLPGAAPPSASAAPPPHGPGQEQLPAPPPPSPPPPPPNRAIPLRGVPYYAWSNRAPGAMRVWLPLA